MSGYLLEKTSLRVQDLPLAIAKGCLTQHCPPPLAASRTTSQTAFTQRWLEYLPRPAISCTRNPILTLEERGWLDNVADHWAHGSGSPEIFCRQRNSAGYPKHAGQNHDKLSCLGHTHSGPAWHLPGPCDGSTESFMCSQRPYRLRWCKSLLEVSEADRP